MTSDKTRLDAMVAAAKAGAEMTSDDARQVAIWEVLVDKFPGATVVSTRGEIPRDETSEAFVVEVHRGLYQSMITIGFLQDGKLSGGLMLMPALGIYYGKLGSYVVGDDEPGYVSVSLVFVFQRWRDSFEQE